MSSYLFSSIFVHGSDLNEYVKHMTTCKTDDNIPLEALQYAVIQQRVVHCQRSDERRLQVAMSVTSDKNYAAHRDSDSRRYTMVYNYYYDKLRGKYIENAETAVEMTCFQIFLDIIVTMCQSADSRKGIGIVPNHCLEQCDG